MKLERISEGNLDEAFADGLSEQPDFLKWVLGGGRFSRYASGASLLREEQRAARPRANRWWKHWWCRLPDGSESETDIFVVLESSGTRFALHVENKPADGTLSMRQAADYRRRAAFKSNDSAWLDYTDFETLLICPVEFARRNADCVAQFDRLLTYEAIAQHLPLFAAALKSVPQV